MQTKLLNTGAWLRSVNLKQTCLGALFVEAKRAPKQALIQRKDALNNLVVKVSRWKRNKCLGNVVSGDISKSRKCAPRVENEIAMQIFHSISHCYVMWKSEALVHCLFYFPLGTKTTILIEGIIRASYHWFQQQSKREGERLLVLAYRTVILACFVGLTLSFTHY